MKKQMIPVIDVAPLRSADRFGWEEVGRQLGNACREIGFFYVVNHGIPESLINDTFSSAKEFFSLPLDEKMKLSMARRSRCFRGYSPVLSELADGKRNSYELLEFSVDLPEDDPDVVAGKPLHGPNIWPDLPAFKDRVDQYTEAQCKLGFDLMKGIALSLGLDPNYFSKAFGGRSFWQFRTVHYPEPENVRRMSGELPPDPSLGSIEIGDFNCGAHTDYGCLTILLSNSSGLQVLGRDGEWFDAPVIPGAYICNIGDMLQYWTGKEYLATKHRVLTDTSRISLPFFFQPDYETLVDPSAVLPGNGMQALKYGPYAYEKYKGIYPNCPA
ncbi:isopenicillin N synthase family dioxygenase [Methylorubrum extorquens]